MRRGDRDDVAERHRDVRDRGANDRQFCGHVLQHFGGADEARRFIQGKRQQTDIPAGEETRQGIVWLLTEIMNIGALRQTGRVDLYHRPHHHQLPVRPRVRHGGEQVDIEALIDDAEKSQPRVAGGILGGVAEGTIERFAEMRGIDAAREAVCIRMPLPLRFVQTGSAREHQVGHSQQRGLALQ